jgi:hypothetical protein
MQMLLISWVCCHVPVITLTYRYNLLREENEGYSKLLTLLLSGGSLKPQQLPSLAREVTSFSSHSRLLSGSATEDASVSRSSKPDSGLVGRGLADELRV